MTIDASAILAIVFRQPGAERVAAAIVRSPVRRMSAVSCLDTLVAVERRFGAESADDAVLILAELNVELAPFDRDQMVEARAAWRRYGSGRHRAALSFAECCAYASALMHSEPLLYTKDNFLHTDALPADW